MSNVGTRPTPGEALTLDCPFCAAPVALVPAQQIDGQSVQCPRCRGQATLTSGRIGNSGRDQWKLIELSFDDERR